MGLTPVTRYSTSMPRRLALVSTALMVALVASAGVPLGFGGLTAASAAPSGTIAPAAGPITGGTRVSVTVPATTRFTTIDTGTEAGVGIDETGAVWSWGQLGRRGTTLPVRVALPGSLQFVEVSADGRTFFALASDESLWAWGDGRSGQLGRGDSASSTVPLRIAIPGEPFITAISASKTPLALDSDGGVWAWGDSSGLGVPVSTFENRRPLRIPLSNIASISSGAESGGQFAVDTSGDGWAWGLNEYGDLGDGTTDSRQAPVPVTLPDDRSFAQIASANNIGTDAYFSGGEHTIALATDGTTWMWGDHPAGEQPYYSYSSRVPIEVPVPDGVEFAQVTDGGDTAFGLTDTGDAWTWGTGLNSGLPVGAPSEQPQRLAMPGDRPVRQVVSSGSTAAALASDGSVFWWGAPVSLSNVPRFNALNTPTPFPVPQPGAVTNVSLDGQAITDFTYSSGVDGTGTVTFSTPAHVSGTVDIIVTSVGTASTLADFTYGTAPEFTSPPLGAGTVDEPYASALTVAGDGPVTYAVTTGTLPAGLRLDRSTGAITGTPATPGTTSFTVTATTPFGAATQEQNVTISGVTPTLTVPSDASLTVGQPYEATLRATGTGPITFSVSGGALPNGVTLDEASGVISGTPTTTGTYAVTFTATGGAGADTRSATFVVLAAAPVRLPAPTITSPSPGQTIEGPVTYRGIGTPGAFIALVSFEGDTPPQSSGPIEDAFAAADPIQVAADGTWSRTIAVTPGDYTTFAVEFRRDVDGTVSLENSSPASGFVSYSVAAAAPAGTPPTTPAAAAPAAGRAPATSSALSLAFTGSHTSGLIGFGALLAASGVALTMAGRRRRTAPSTSPTTSAE